MEEEICNNMKEEKVKVEGGSCNSKEDGKDLWVVEEEIYNSKVQVGMVMVVVGIYSNMEEEVMVMMKEGSCSNKKVEEGIYNSMRVVVEVVTCKESMGVVRVKGVGESCNNMVCDKE